jgi:hypothetical protein
VRQSHTRPAFPRVPNQVDEKYYYVDISCDTDINLHWNDYDWIYVFDYFKKHPKLAATFATKWVNKTAGLCSWKQNQSKNELDAWENESYTWKRYQSYNKKVQFLEKLFQAGYYAHQFQSNYLPRQKNWVGTKNSSTSLTTKYQRSLKAGLECIFLTHNANLHKINLEKAFKARRNTLDTREPRTENQSVWRPAVQSTCKASFN